MFDLIYILQQGSLIFFFFFSLSESFIFSYWEAPLVDKSLETAVSSDPRAKDMKTREGSAGIVTHKET